ncbi:unnamed protein product [Schistosoma mattheei]|uniref:Uncharacterized protein n=1 Tax=Schistosoma mattheei TaxID=31246 RepID=A0A183NW94_9TREM|nr:unnamed protein product [Schistosoma mattheei]
MVVGGSQQETLDPGFVLLGTRQQGVPSISSGEIANNNHLLTKFHMNKLCFHNYFKFPDRFYCLNVVVGLAYGDEPIELYWLEKSFLKVLPCQTCHLKSGKTKSNKPKVRRRSRTADCREK